MIPKLAPKGLAVLAAGLCACVASPVAAADTIQPGYWESTSHVLSPIQSTKTDRRCITAKEVSKFMSCYINHHYQCSCPEQSYADGKIHFVGECVSNKGDKAKISGDGAYTATTFRMTANVSFHLMGMPVSAEASTDAHRIGDVCPTVAK